MKVKSIDLFKRNDLAGVLAIRFNRILKVINLWKKENFYGDEYTTAKKDLIESQSFSIPVINFDEAQIHLDEPIVGQNTRANAPKYVYYKVPYSGDIQTLEFKPKGGELTLEKNIFLSPNTTFLIFRMSQGDPQYVKKTYNELKAFITSEQKKLNGELEYFNNQITIFVNEQAEIKKKGFDDNDLYISQLKE